MGYKRYFTIEAHLIAKCYPDWEEAQNWEDESEDDMRTLMVEVDLDGIMRVLGCDHGEPEDNVFWRDWKWVETELNKAYEAGLAKGRE